MLKQHLTIIVVIFFILSLIAKQAYGVVVPALYSFQIPVKTRSEKERHEALQKAFKRVLIKVSGRTGSVMDPEMDTFSEHVEDYVETFSYLSKTDGTYTDLLFRVSFNKSSVDTLLRRLGQTVWERNRPLILVWLVIEKGGNQRIVDQGHDPLLSTLMINKASSRGVPFIFPLLDMTDMQQVSAEDIVALRTTVIREASKRYVPDGILIGRIDTTNEKEVMGDWMLLESNKSSTWETVGGQFSTVIRQGVNRSVDLLAKSFTPPTRQEQGHVIALKVDGLTSISDYAKLMKYLHTLTGVADVKVLHVSTMDADFQLTLDTSLSSLKRTIQLDRILESVETGDREEGVLYYRFHV